MFLNTHSYYSLRYGTLSVDDIIGEALELGIRKLALTDINNSTGALEFAQKCREAGIEAVAGIEFRQKGRQLFTGIARNNTGFAELNELLSCHNINKSPLDPRNGKLENCYIIYPSGGTLPDELLENEFIGLGPASARKLAVGGQKADKLVILHPVVYKTAEQYQLHIHLRAIDNNILLSKVHSGMAAHLLSRMLPESSLRKLYSLHPQAISKAEKLLKNCSFDFDFSSTKNKKSFTGSRYDDRLLLEKLAWDGLEYRYGAGNREAVRRIKHELEIIDKLGFSSYFLITWDIIRYSMSRDFYHVGRGSGANSIVAYCLKITDVDPIELNLFFERFINPKRTSPPDFDIDYSWKERDQVLDYIFKRYGRKHTALLGTMSTFKGKSILRELGKVYGLPKPEIDKLTERPDATSSRDEILKKILHTGRMMANFPNLRSIHAGGVLISEEPITAYTALDMPPKGYPTTQWDMYIAEDIGFEKLDILSQRGIGHIKECADIVRENRGIDVDIHRIQEFKKNEKVKSQLKNSDTIGCFYIESPAMRGLLKKLRCDNYISLVAASSIIRPGVARSGMMKEYIRRFHNPGRFKYIHPVMEEQLSETYGVMVFQEDVLKICHHFAGLDLADADVLRRAMSGKHRSKTEFQRIVDKFFVNCKEKGHTDAIAKEVWRQIESFAGYSFSKAHSASYAAESMQSLYLKAHYPLEFMVAVINNFGGFYQTWVYVNEARSKGAVICLPCVNLGKYTTSIIAEKIYLGFIHIQNLEISIGKAIEKERLANGLYRDLEDFVCRIQAGIEQTTLLIRINAFRFTGKSRQELMWEAHMLLGSRQKRPVSSLFNIPPKKFSLPALQNEKTEDVFDEIELLGFPVSMNHFDLLKTGFRGDVKARQLTNFIGKTVRMLGVLVTIKYVRTIKNEIMNFGTFFDDEGKFFDTVHFPPTLRKFPFRGKGVYIMAGKVVEEFGFPSLEVEKMAKMPFVADPRYE